MKSLLQAIGSNAVLEHILVGYRSAFRTRADAERCIANYGLTGHEHPDAIKLHIGFANRARPSDYPVLFHLYRLLPDINSIVDIGGSTGNLFYSYCRYLPFPAQLSWTVCDFKDAVAIGKELAINHSEPRLSFTTDLDSCAPADAVIISGALHYFEQMPPELLSSWPRKPKYIFINRSPVSEEPSVYAVQDSGTWFTTACVIHRGTLLDSMKNAGYLLVDEWRVLELNVWFPLHPQNSVYNYSGFLFSLEVAGPQ